METLPKLQDSNKLGIAHAGYSWGEPRELYYDVVQPAGSAKIKVLSWAEPPTANIDLQNASKDFTKGILKHHLPKQFQVAVVTGGQQGIPSIFLNDSAPRCKCRSRAHADKSIIRNEIFGQLETVVRWREEWDEEEEEHEPERPSEKVIERAKQVVNELWGVVVSADKPLHTPFISYDQDGYITMEWRNGKHELYLEIREDKIHYVKVWGINIDSEMDAGVPSTDNYLTLWEWLLNG